MYAPAGEMEMSLHREFLQDHGPCRLSNLDNYFVRRSILHSLRQSMPRFRGALLDVGCGEQPYRDLIRLEAPLVRSYTGLDLDHPYYRKKPDLLWDGTAIPLADRSVDVVLLTEVLEHCPDPAGVLREIHRVLKPDGWLFFTVPFVWPLHDVPYDEYRYTPFALGRLLGGAGFPPDRQELWALGGTDATLATVLGIWIKRRPMPGFVRHALGLALYPVLRGLYWLNGKRKIRFEEAELPTGFAGLAQA